MLDSGLTRPFISSSLGGWREVCGGSYAEAWHVDPTALGIVELFGQLGAETDRLTVNRRAWVEHHRSNEDHQFGTISLEIFVAKQGAE